MTDQQTINSQRDKIDDKNSEIQRLHDRMELLGQADIKNFEQHKQILEKMDTITKTLLPIADTYKSVGIMAKWVMAFLVFLSILGGIIWTWINIFKSRF